MTKLFSLLLGIAGILITLHDISDWLVTGGLKVTLKGQSGSTRWYWSEDPARVVIGLGIELLCLAVGIFLVYSALKERSPEDPQRPE